uniref:Uncharacterized protein n=2 Tax=Anguilla anguilla TaxID=7936 RepID=A0A0E9U0F2_ANGAN
MNIKYFIEGLFSLYFNRHFHFVLFCILRIIYWKQNNRFISQRSSAEVKMF